MQQKQIILESIQNLPEDDFSRSVLMPLLSKIGYINIEFNGGAYEQGKDIIAHMPAALGKDEIHVFQSKKFKSKKARQAEKASPNTYTNLIYASESRLHYQMAVNADLIKFIS